MGIAMEGDDEGLNAFIESTYAAALSPQLWPGVLAELARFYDSGFADVSTRSQDGEHACGLAHGLDAADYDDLFMGRWRKRNVWRRANPVRIAGEVSSTRSLIDVAAFKRSEMYADYLDPRGLHEGLRLVLSADADGVQVVSVLRPWSRGPFGQREIASGRVLLPHLRRAAAVTRHLHGIGFDGEAARCRGDAAVFAFDAAGKLCWANAAAESLLTEETLVAVARGEIKATTPSATVLLRSAVAKAVGRSGGPRIGGTVRLLTADGGLCRSATVLPVAGHGAWSCARPRAAIAIIRQPPAASARKARLRGVFAFTEAEADLAVRLLDGGTLGLISEATGRSINTVRTHLYHLMGKTGTSRQVELICLLEQALREGASDEAGTPTARLGPFDPARPPAMRVAPRLDRAVGTH